MDYTFDASTDIQTIVLRAPHETLMKAKPGEEVTFTVARIERLVIEGERH